jgi:hypothetical protein
VATVIEQMVTTLRGYWTGATGYQRLLYVVGTLLVAFSIVPAILLVASGGNVEGDTSWRKPVTFAEAFGLTAVTIAWVMTYLPKRRWIGWPIAVTLAIANTGEVAWVFLQQLRGVPSHFNEATAFDAGLFSGAGVLIGFATLAIVVVTVWSAFALTAPPSLALAIRAGLLLLLVGMGFGYLMIGNGGHTVGQAGELKLPHALGIHAAQALPLLAWLLLFTRFADRTQLLLTALGILGYAAAVAFSAAQAFSGRPPQDVGGLAVFGMTIGLAVVAAGYAVALVGLWQAGQRDKPVARPT